MAQHGLNLLAATFVWWLSTGLVIMACARPRRSLALTAFGVLFVLFAGLYAIEEAAFDTSVKGAYVAFLGALAVWACIEITFLLGYVTGPRTTPCPPGATGWRRFRLAAETLLYHEFAIATAACVLVALTWGAPNQTGTLAFLVLLVMRISAKLNIFLGVPNLSDEFLPERLSYLKSYFRKKSFSLFFPISIASASIAAMVFAERALHAAAPAAAGFMLLFGLTALAILEHFFMIMPLPDAALWRWAMPPGAPKQTKEP